MVSVTVSKIDRTDLIFVQPRAKINNVYYRDNIPVFLAQLGKYDGMIFARW